MSKTNENIKKAFINTTLNSNNRNKKQDDFVRMFLKDMQQKLKKVTNVIYQK